MILKNDYQQGNYFTNGIAVNRIQEKCQPRYDAGHDEDWFVDSPIVTFFFLGHER